MSNAMTVWGTDNYNLDLMDNITDIDYDFLEYIDKFQETLRQGMYTHRTPLTICLIIAYVVSIILGLFGNSLVFIVVAKHKQMRSVTYLLLVNLAVGDIMVVFVSMPLTLGYMIYRVWVYGEIMCRLTPFLQGLSVSVSVLTLVVVSADRYYKIYHPMKARVLFDKARVRCMVVAVWVASTVLMIPFLLVNHTIEDPEFGLTVCIEQWTHINYRRTFNVFLFLVLYVIPMAFMVYAYYTIATTLWHGDSKLYHAESQRQKLDIERLQQQRRKLVKMIIALTVIFALTWLPYHIVILWMDFKRDGGKEFDASEKNIAINVFPLVQWLALSNSSLNPLCYCLFSKKFQTSVKMLMKCSGEQDKSLERFDTDQTPSTVVRWSWRNLSSKFKRAGVHEMVNDKIEENGNIPQQGNNANEKIQTRD